MTPVATKAKKTNAKRAGRVIDPRLTRLLVWMVGPGRTFVLGVLIVAAFAVGIWRVWLRYSPRVFSSDEYWVTADCVDITPPPRWIRSDVRAKVFQDASLDHPLSLGDPALTARIHNAFSLHPWVAKVVDVAKSAPARIAVELIYREPVCMVRTGEQLLPVDAEGVLLPEDEFSPVEKAHYPRLERIQTVPVGPPGARWGDALVYGGAEIAAAFGPAWYELSLDRIVPSQPRESGSPDEAEFELYTRGGTRILWGRAPGTDLPGEIPAAEKVARLVRYKQEYGTLEGIGGPQPLDVRSLRSMGTAPAIP